MPMTDGRKLDGVARGVAEAWDGWLADHPLRTPEAVTEGVRRAVADFLAKNRAEVVAAIADRAFERAEQGELFAIPQPSDKTGSEWR